MYESPHYYYYYYIRVNIRSFRTWTPDIYAYGNVEAQFKYNGLLNNLKTQVSPNVFYKQSFYKLSFLINIPFLQAFFFFKNPLL